MFESLIPKEKYSKLEISVKDRNLLHIEIMKLMLKELNDDTELKWMNENGGRVSAIIDNTDNIEIREFILKGESNKASLIIKDILEKESQNSEMQKAA